LRSKIRSGWGGTTGQPKTLTIESTSTWPLPDAGPSNSSTTPSSLEFLIIRA
jgi:hypothetical protein